MVRICSHSLVVDNQFAMQLNGIYKNNKNIFQLVFKHAFIIHPLLSRFFDITAIQDVQC